MRRFLLGLDTATEVTVVALGAIEGDRLELLDAAEVDARRAAMSRVLPVAAELLDYRGLPVTELSQIVVGRGPGSFTGVRIGVAAAKGLAHGLGVPLYGVGTLDAVAWGFTAHEGLLGIVGDAMRGEVYPALFRVTDGRVERLGPDVVEKPAAAAEAWGSLGKPLLLAGNGLGKHADVFLETLGSAAALAPEDTWAPSGAGMLNAYASARTHGGLGSGDPGELLPVYARLSDAEEAENRRVGAATKSTPDSGVCGPGRGRA